MQIIGLTGQPFNGKDTAARYLSDVHGFHPIAFADPLRAGLKAMLGLTDDDFTPERKERVIHWLGKTRCNFSSLSAPRGGKQSFTCRSGVIGRCTP